MSGQNLLFRTDFNSKFTLFMFLISSWVHLVIHVFQGICTFHLCYHTHWHKVLPNINNSLFFWIPVESLLSFIMIMAHFAFSFFFFEFYFIYFFIQQVLISFHFIHISVYMSILISQFITQPPPPLSPLGVHTFVLYICVSYFCPANRFICTIFLGSTYMH